MGVIYKEDLPRLLTDLKDLESKIKKKNGKVERQGNTRWTAEHR
jgi:hypothetical protein